MFIDPDGFISYVNLCDNLFLKYKNCVWYSKKMSWKTITDFFKYNCIVYNTLFIRKDIKKYQANMIEQARNFMRILLIYHILFIIKIPKVATFCIQEC